MNQEELNQQLLCACANGELELVKKLVNYGANIYYTNYHTSLEIASSYCHLEVVKWLYSIGYDPTAKDNTAIQMASCEGILRVMGYWYPVRYNHTYDKDAIKTARVKMVKFLALVGCDTNKIYNLEMRKEVIEYLNKYKPIMDQCIAEIYGNPRLERTKTENETSFKEYLSK